MKTTYENEVITQTVVATGMLTGVSIGTIQEDFHLNEADFLRLKNESSSFTSWALMLLSGTVGYAISIFPKWLSELAGKPEKVTASEWAALFIAIAITIILYFIGKCMPSDRSKLIEKMTQHFKDAPKSRQIIKGPQ